MKTSKTKAVKKRIQKVKEGYEAGAIGNSHKLPRSMPMAQVNALVENLQCKHEADKTIYNDRLDILNQIDCATRDIEYYEQQVHNLNCRKLQLQQELNRINTAITRELDLDELR